jgi:hypothetical protein
MNIWKWKRNFAEQKWKRKFFGGSENGNGTAKKRKWAIYYNTRNLLSWNKTTQSTRKQPKICLNYLACIGEPKGSMLVVKCSCVPLVPNFQDIRKVIGALSLRLVRTYHQENIECANHVARSRECRPSQILMRPQSIKVNRQQTKKCWTDSGACLQSEYTPQLGHSLFSRRSDIHILFWSGPFFW